MKLNYNISKQDLDALRVQNSASANMAKQQEVVTSALDRVKADTSLNKQSTWMNKE